jgi:hypothetical protein
VLEFALHMAECHGPHCGMTTGRALRKRDAERCVARGWLREDQGIMIDGDGYHVEPERRRRVYIITDVGRAALAAVEHGQGGAP